MAARHRKSRKQSAPNSGSPPRRSPLVIFVDRSLGRKVIAERLRERGVRVEIHDDHFPQNALDEDWIAEVGRRGWVILTKDDRLRYRPAAIEAYRRHRVKVFVFGSGEIKAQQMADAFIKALPRVIRISTGRKGPFFGRISKTGLVSILSA